MSRFETPILFALSLSGLSVACSSSKSEDGKERPCTVPYVKYCIRPFLEALS